jgi:glutaredoxin-like YruB-family protein
MTVKVYSTPSCPWCQLVKEFLEEHKIPFESIDITQNQEAMNYMIEKTEQIGVPVIEIDDKFVIGFRKADLMEALNIIEPAA